VELLRACLLFIGWAENLMQGDRQMPLRVIQWSTGNVGTYALRAIINHPELELAGVIVHSPEKAGKDAAELCGLEESTGVRSTTDWRSLLDAGADCVTPRAPRPA
jgi:hypothetical protein